MSLIGFPQARAFAFTTALSSFGLTGCNSSSSNNAPSQTDTGSTSMYTDTMGGSSTSTGSTGETDTTGETGETGGGMECPYIERVSVSSFGTQANGESSGALISGNGLFVVFYSSATNLVENDVDGGGHYYLRDLQAGLTEIINVRPEGGSRGIVVSAISDDARYLAFRSEEADIVPDDTNDLADAFVYDRETDITERVSVSSSGVQGNNRIDGFIGMSGDGRYVVFPSDSDNLVPNDTNAASDIFVRDRNTDTTERVSVGLNGAEANGSSHFDPAISSNGRYVTFRSMATNLVPDDTTIWEDVFVYDRDTGAMDRVSLSTSGEESLGVNYVPMISAGGRFVSFASNAENLAPIGAPGPDVFFRDRTEGTTKIISVAQDGTPGEWGGDYHTFNAATARYVAFMSNGSNLVPNDDNDAHDVFVYDRFNELLKRVSIGQDGQEANGATSLSSWRHSFTLNGEFLLFSSAASNLIDADTNDAKDVFIIGMDCFFEE